MSTLYGFSFVACSDCLAGDLAGRKQDLKEAAKLNANGLLLSSQSKRAAAVAEFEQATTTYKYSPIYFCNLGNEYLLTGLEFKWPGDIYERMKRGEFLEKAIAAYDQALALDPVLTDVAYNRAYAFFRLGKHDKGAAGLKQVLAIDHEHFQANLTLGMWSLYLGDQAWFLSDFKKPLGYLQQASNCATAKQPDNAALVALAFSTVEDLKKKQAQKREQLRINCPPCLGPGTNIAPIKNIWEHLPPPIIVQQKSPERKRRRKVLH